MPLSTFIPPPAAPIDMTGVSTPAEILARIREAESRDLDPAKQGTISQSTRARPVLEQLDRSVLAAGYRGATKNAEEAFDKYLAPRDVVQEARDFYENELPFKDFPGAIPLAALGSTLAGPAFDFYRAAQTDPLNVLSLGAPTAALSPTLGAVRKRSKFGTVEFPHRLEELSAAGVHKLEPKTLSKDVPILKDLTKAEKNLIKQRVSKHGNSFAIDDALFEITEGRASTPKIVEEWRERLAPRFVDGPYAGEKAIGALADIDPAMSTSFPGAVGAAFRDQVQQGADFQRMLTRSNMLRTADGRRLTSRTPGIGDDFELPSDIKGTTLRKIIDAFEESPPGPNVMHSLMDHYPRPGDPLYNFSRGRSVIDYTDFFRHQQEQDRAQVLENIVNHPSGKRLLHSLEEYRDALKNHRNRVMPWRAHSASISYPGGTTSLGVGSSNSLQDANSYLLGERHGGLGASTFGDRHLPAPFKHLENVSMQYPVDPQAYIPGAAPMYGHLLQPLTSDLYLPFTEVAEGGHLVAKAETFLPWVRAVKGPEVAKKMEQYLKVAQDDGIMKGNVPSLMQLLYTEPATRGLISGQAGSAISIPKGQSLLSLEDMMLHMNKRYNDYLEPQGLFDLGDPFNPVTTIVAPEDGLRKALRGTK